MRSYYTYGAIPDPVQTVRGYADGGLTKGPEVALAGAGGEDKPLVQQLYERGEISDAEYRAWLAQQAQEQAPLSTYPRPPDEMAGPSQEYNPVTRLPTIRSGLESAQPAPATDYGWKGDLESGKNVMDFFNLQREREFGPGALQSFAGPTGGGTPVQPGQFSLYNPNERSAAQVAADYAKASGLDLAGFAKSQGMSEAELMSQINKTEMDPTTQRGALNEIKSLAGAGDFQGAFEAAKAAEARMPGQDFVSKLVSPESLRYIAPEMDKKDVDNYFDALKNVVGEKEYEQRYVGTGNKVDFDQAKERSMQAIDQGAGFVNPDLGVKAEKSIIGTIGGLAEPVTKAAAALAAAYALAPGMFGAAPTAGAGTAGTAGAAGGTSGLQALTASQLAQAPTLAQIAAGIGAPSIPGLGAIAAGTAGAAAAADAIPEILVSASKAGKLSEVVGALAKAGLGSATASALSKMAAPSISPTQPTPPGEPTSPLEEIQVTARRPVVPPLAKAALATTGAATAANLQPGDILPEGGPETIDVTKSRLTDGLNFPEAVLAAGPTLAEIAQQLGQPGVPDLAEPPLEEVVSQQPRIKYPPPVIPPLPIFPEPQLQPPPKAEDILKDYQPTEIKQPSTVEDLIKKYGTLENALKVLGALGAGSAMAGGTAGGTGGLGKYDTSGGASFGAGLTPVQFGRKQLSPDIDYYTYATRPEAKFFEYNTQLAQPTQPGPVVPTPVQPSGVITQAAGGYVDENMTGGLIGYAKGGDAKPERYVDGPGSGRDDKIPAMLSDGEYVIDAETLALLGDGSTKEGARRLDKFRAKIRQHKGRALSRGRISPNAKSPEKYMGGGLS